MKKQQHSEIAVNPFSVKTPENLTADELVDLFVPYPEFENLQISGHQFLNGHRGSGKSMMLRMMSPDSQMLWRNCELLQLPYFGVYFSIKATELNAPEYVRLEGEASGTILSEHVLTTRMLSALISNTASYCAPLISSAEQIDALRKVVTQVLFKKLEYAGWNGEVPQESSNDFATIKNIFNFIIRLIDEIHIVSVQYIKRRSFQGATQPYQGTLLGFQDVLLPVVQELTASGIIPNAPVYFLLDDADNLTKQQTQILNTWVSYRSTGSISLKISTQLNYKTFNTTSGVAIESPHDFSSINFTSVHTGSVKERYPALVASIVRKRLIKYGSAVDDPYVFFPEDVSQKEAIKKIAEDYKQKWLQGESGSYRPEDDAYRYARPEYIRRLSGSSKQGARFRYAGFEQLVHLSSGIIRFFLEPAARMFTEQSIINAGIPVTSISTTVQDQELRKQADELLLRQFDLLALEAEKSQISSAQLNDIDRLKNIVYGIGALFKAYAMDERSTQRRVFSFSISGEPSKAIKAILHMGVVHGYFYLDSIGAKSGMGRSTLYVLTRRLAPAFSLDPVGFSSYLTVTNEFLETISVRPQTVINRIRRKGILSVLGGPDQLSLLDGALDA
ncbi:MAG: hypothetical protein M0003_09720 [Acidithiobacillus sp.]|nr:hypothetical protein [Acidithiobacillus sp.]